MYEKFYIFSKEAFDNYSRDFKTDNHKVEIQCKERFQSNIMILLKPSAKIFSKRFFVHDIKVILNFNYFSYKEILDDVLPLEARIGAFEIVGDIIHLNLTKPQFEYKKIIGTVLHKKYKKTVVTKTEKINNIHRNYELEVLAGNKENLKTIIFENNAKICIDLKHVYWSSRLQNERKNLFEEIVKSKVNMNSKEIIVCDLFCGAGPHILPLLKFNAQNFKIKNKKEGNFTFKAIANDINPHAISCLKESIKINKLNLEDITMFNDDTNNVLEIIRKIPVTHYIFNLPEWSLYFTNLLLLQKNSHPYVIHCYFFCQNHIQPEAMVAEKLGLISFKHIIKPVRDVSPSKKVFKLTIYYNSNI